MYFILPSCIKTTLIALAIFLMLPSYAFADETEDIKKVVVAYNFGIVKMAKSSTIEHMVNIISKKRANKLHLWIKSWHDNNLFMDTSLPKMEFTNVNIGKGVAKVFVNEEWLYRYINIKTKKITHPATRIIYTMKYELIKKNHGWIIDDVKTLSEKQEKLVSSSKTSN